MRRSQMQPLQCPRMGQCPQWARPFARVEKVAITQHVMLLDACPLAALTCWPRHEHLVPKLLLRCVV